ncbi:hypothetical protein NAS2_0734 [Conexivisphaera calida]|uniref:HTH arsR-type domain-containing protein n=2 Tax=Conexivisphaera calida TaxID=1874277 RepID=A0A4P2VF67_9ARCH|nr:hypothetical protein NAS2_0734 [Conexivisphaera calida]
MVVDRDSLKLLSDPLNMEIVRELVFSERTVGGLAESMNVPSVKIWRRVLRMQRAGLIRQTRTEKVRNLERKYYRAAAAMFVPQQMMDVEPRSGNLRRALAIYSEIQARMLRDLVRTEVPDDAEDLIDRVISIQLRKFVDTFLSEDTADELRRIRELLH